MNLKKRRATILLCSAAMVALTSSAYAKPVHKKAAHRHSYHRQAVAPAVPAFGNTAFSGADRDPRYSAGAMQTRQAEAPSAPVATTRRGRRAQAAAMAQQTSGFSSFGGSSSLVAEARKYLGTNPTGRRSLWCGAFMDMVLRRTGHAGGGNLAKAYASYGRRVSGPQVGAIAVMGRKGGGHVGVVSGVDPNGNPIIVSGNHNRTVAESVYPAGRIQAYVLPGG
nr:TIGR02594 family protein [Pseudolabrys taiwanensis]